MFGKGTGKYRKRKEERGIENCHTGLGESPAQRILRKSIEESMRGGWKRRRNPGTYRQQKSRKAQTEQLGPEERRR